MRTALTERFGIRYPIFGFTPSEHVAAAITRAGGMGVLGCVRFDDPEELDATLTWMSQNTDGLPFGVDVVMPAKAPTEGAAGDLKDMIPQEHRDFVARTLAELNVPELEGQSGPTVLGWLHSNARAQVEVALRHRPALIANALGSPPADVIAAAKDAGVAVAALAGSVEHARRHVAEGVDIVISQGHEAGGHTGEITTMVLTPQVVDAVGSEAAVLAAGGIGSGRQVAASLALGADGVWLGSRWLTAAEYQLGREAGDRPSVVQQAILNAGSGDTVRSRVYSGKPARLLRTRWTDAWQAADAPEPLPMPLQNLLVSEAHQRISAGDDPSVVAMPAGQIVGMIDEIESVDTIMAELVDGYRAAVDRLGEIG
ncbi:NAD(P)H-dependent flavin oxidoreductase [Enemella sp. A6]|uniref:NAD(P)H-dependent flavin oxidoreductase n=1 Tax=Enemella sp. A6 TaxID=3440152 RepID=UPI003EB71316